MTLLYIIAITMTLAYIAMLIMFRQIQRLLTKAYAYCDNYRLILERDRETHASVIDAQRKLINHYREALHLEPL